MIDSDADPLDQALAALQRVSPTVARGRVNALTGLVVRATVPGLRVGDRVEILRGQDDMLSAEVVGFLDDQALLMPFGDPIGIGPASLVEASGRRPSIRCGRELLGRVLDGLGTPIDGGPLLVGKMREWAIDRDAPPPLTRPPIHRPLPTGVRALDGMLTLGEGQRIGLFAGPGAGKSTLMAQIARQSEVDVCVLCLVGERGREVREFIEGGLGEGLQRSVVICATSDMSPMVRMKSASVATAVAEYFRAEGKRVLLLVDSLTRYARALREVGLAAGEMPARRGFPPSVFAALPRLLERSGHDQRGSITAIYTVLVEGNDLDDPIAEEVRGLLDGHIVLTRALAQQGHWPAIDIVRSLSRVMPQIVSTEQYTVAARVRHLLSSYESQRELIMLGAYKSGSDPDVDESIARRAELLAFLQQSAEQMSPFSETISAMSKILS